jgi:diguanylate cyclase (GGDEF)-like protein
VDSPFAPHRFRILLVEDDPAWQHLIVEGLAEQGIDVQTVGSAARAIESLDAAFPAAVLVDAVLPEGNGFDACARLRGHLGDRAIPIVVLSGQDNEASIERAFEAGASDFFVKSLQWKLLAQRLSQLVASARLQSEIVSSRRRLERAKGLAARASQSAREARDLAWRDALTGWLSRTGFLKSAQGLLDDSPMSGEQRAALLLIDLDRFKRLNDSLGTDAGDETLCEVANRLQQAFRNLPGLAMGRLASDEFAILFQSLPSGRAAERAAQIALTALRRPIDCGGLEFVQSASIGIALTSIHCGIESMMVKAGQALSGAKLAGGSTARTFVGTLGSSGRDRFDLENALHQALDRDELRLHYQPIIDPATHRLAGLEALMRWQHDDRLLYPDEFIPLAEETSLIFRMGEWAVGEALRQTSQWRGAGLMVPTVSVNIHVRHLEQPELAESVSKALESTGLDASTLELELTETGVMRDIKRSLGSLHGLKHLGVRLALDDFGTGYSSLAYLTQLPIDTLKIDRSFIDQLGENGQSRAVVRSITALAQALGLSTVAEGVETRSQLDSLRALGCNEVQGYLFARPMPADDLPQWWSGFRGMVPDTASARGGKPSGFGARGKFPILPVADSSPLGAIYV